MSEPSEDAARVTSMTLRERGYGGVTSVVGADPSTDAEVSA